ncbi:MAG TPA: hypothetical protein VIY26_07420 [Acidimicrobiales bacterium]
MLHRAKIGIGIATIGMAVALMPAVGASANAKPVGIIETSAFCKAYKSELQQSGKADSGSIVKAMESGNWSEAQKALLSVYNSSGKQEKIVEGLLNGAPGNVKSAATVELKFDGTLKSIIQKATSLTQFESNVETAETSPKVQAATKTLDAYTQKQCPGLVNTTPST